MTWGRRFTQDELNVMLARCHARLVKRDVLLEKARKAPEHRPPAKRGPKPKTEGRTHHDKHSRRLAYQVVAAGLPSPLMEWAFDQQLDGAGLRNWRIDIAYPFITPPLAIEVDGIVHRIQGRHEGDFEKHQALFKAGWKLLRVSPSQVRSGEALELVREALA